MKSFVLLIGDMLSVGGGCELVVTTQSGETRLEEVWGATTSSHIPPPLLQDLWPCVQLFLCEGPAMLHASETWPLTETNLQGHDQTDVQYRYLKPEDVATVRSSYWSF